MKYVLGIDIGTTAIKAAVFAENGRLCGSHTCEYTLLTPATAMVEMHAATYEAEFKNAVTLALQKAGIDKEQVVALGISAQGETLFCLDEQGQPLRPAIVWMDNRATEEAAWIEEKLGRQNIHHNTGQVSMAALWPASKILWIKKHEAQVFAATAKFLLIEDYFVYRLTGKFVSEDSLLCSTMYWNIQNREYWPEMLDLLGIRTEQLPEICRPGAAVGQILPEAAKKFGLSTGTLVCLGALDQACGAIGVGNVHPGIFSESTGAALATVAMSSKPVFDPAGELPCFAGAMPGMYMIHAFSTGGMAMRWYRDAFCQAEMEVERQGGGNAYTLIDHEVLSVPPGSDGLRAIPHLQGSGPPDTDDAAKGVFLHITLTHGKAHFARALMEGVTMVLCRMMEATASLGAEIKEIRSLSGGAKSAAWSQIKADATGVPVRTMKTTENAACLGAAILAGVSAGIWPSVEQAAADFVEFDREFIPNPAHKGLYAAMLAEYKRNIKELGPIFRRNAGANGSCN